MAKHKRREQEPTINESRNNNMMNENNNPFGIDPMQLLGLLGGNFDMRNMSNMLASMNTNGFNLNNLGPLAQMAGLNLDNNFNNTNNNFNNLNNNLNNNSNRNNVNSNFNTNVQNKSDDSSNLNKNQTNASRHEDSGNKGNNQKVNSQNEVRRGNSNNEATQDRSKIRDENLEFLLSLRSFVHQSKVPFVDKIIDGYKNGVFK